MTTDAVAILRTAAGRRSALLQSVVEVARATFKAGGASVAVLDGPRGDFVFEAVTGDTQLDLIGARFPASDGLAGVVAQSGEPIIVDDLSSHPDFARDIATETGYVPNAMMIAPLTLADRTLGVLSVLDRGESGRSALQELELLGHLAAQAAIAIEVSDAAARVAADLESGLDERRREALARLLEAADELRSP